MPSKKEKLNPHQAMIAEALRNQGHTLGQIARHFNRTKPTILKSLGLWKIKGEDLVKRIMGENVSNQQARKMMKLERGADNDN